MIFQEAALNIVMTIMLMAGLPIEDQELQADIYCGAHNIYFEAGDEPIEGMIAIADVTINRKNDTRWPDSMWYGKTNSLVGHTMVRVMTYHYGVLIKYSYGIRRFICL